MPEVRVQLPLGACGGVRVGTGRRLLTAPTQVRFLSPQLESNDYPAGSQRPCKLVSVVLVRVRVPRLWI